MSRRNQHQEIQNRNNLREEEQVSSNELFGNRTWPAQLSRKLGESKRLLEHRCTFRYSSVGIQRDGLQADHQTLDNKWGHSLPPRDPYKPRVLFCWGRVQLQQQFLRFDNTVPSNKLLLCGVTVIKPLRFLKLLPGGARQITDLRPWDRFSISKSLSKHLVVRDRCPNYQRNRTHDFQVAWSHPLDYIQLGWTAGRTLSEFLRNDFDSWIAVCIPVLNYLWIQWEVTHVERPGSYWKQVLLQGNQMFSNCMSSDFSFRENYRSDQRSVTRPEGRSWTSSPAPNTPLTASPARLSHRLERIHLRLREGRSRKRVHNRQSQFQLQTSEVLSAAVKSLRSRLIGM